MTTTMYLRNEQEIRAAARIVKQAGYITSAADIRAHDRYVINIVARFGGGPLLEQSIVTAITRVREARDAR